MTQGFQKGDFLFRGIGQAGYLNIAYQLSCIGAEGLKEESKIMLPKNLQEQMIQFFLKTSILKKKQEKDCLLSKNNLDGSGTDE